MAPSAHTARLVGLFGRAGTPSVANALPPTVVADMCALLQPLRWQVVFISARCDNMIPLAVSSEAFRVVVEAHRARAASVVGGLLDYERQLRDELGPNLQAARRGDKSSARGYYEVAQAFRKVALAHQQPLFSSKEDGCCEAWLDFERLLGRELRPGWMLRHTHGIAAVLRRSARVICGASRAELGSDPFGVAITAMFDKKLLVDNMKQLRAQTKASQERFAFFFAIASYGHEHGRILQQLWAFEKKCRCCVNPWHHGDLSTTRSLALLITSLAQGLGHPSRAICGWEKEMAQHLKPLLLSGLRCRWKCGEERLGAPHVEPPDQLSAAVTKVVIACHMIAEEASAPDGLLAGFVSGRFPVRFEDAIAILDVCRRYSDALRERERGPGTSTDTQGPTTSDAIMNLHALRCFMVDFAIVAAEKLTRTIKGSHGQRERTREEWLAWFQVVQHIVVPTPGIASRVGVLRAELMGHLKHFTRELMQGGRKDTPAAATADTRKVLYVAEMCGVVDAELGALLTSAVLHYCAHSASKLTNMLMCLGSHLDSRTLTVWLATAPEVDTLSPSRLSFIVALAGKFHKKKAYDRDACEVATRVEGADALADLIAERVLKRIAAAPCTEDPDGCSTTDLVQAYVHGRLICQCTAEATPIDRPIAPSWENNRRSFWRIAPLLRRLAAVRDWTQCSDATQRALVNALEHDLLWETVIAQTENGAESGHLPTDALNKLDAHRWTDAVPELPQGVATPVMLQQRKLIRQRLARSGLSLTSESGESSLREASRSRESGASASDANVASDLCRAQDEAEFLF